MGRCCTVTFVYRRCFSYPLCLKKSHFTLEHIVNVRTAVTNFNCAGINFELLRVSDVYCCWHALFYSEREPCFKTVGSHLWRCTGVERNCASEREKAPPWFSTCHSFSLSLLCFVCKDVFVSNLTVLLFTCFIYLLFSRLYFLRAFRLFPLDTSRLIDSQCV